MKFFLRQEPKQPDPISRLNGKQRLKESALIMALLLTLFLCISLFSYDAADPSWSQTAWDGPIKNAAGSMGAWVADTLFFSLGLLAYPLPFVLLSGGWMLFRRDKNIPINLHMLGTKLLGGVLLLLTSCGLADLNFDDFGYFSSGGVVGDVVVSIGLPFLNPLGTTLVMMFFWAAGFTLMTGISWMTVAEFIGEKTLSMVTKAVNYIRGDKPLLISPSIYPSNYDPDYDHDDDPLFASPSKELEDFQSKNPFSKKNDSRFSSSETDFSRPANDMEDVAAIVPVYSSDKNEPDYQSDVFAVPITQSQDDPDWDMDFQPWQDKDDVTLDTATPIRAPIETFEDSYQKTHPKKEEKTTAPQESLDSILERVMDEPIDSTTQPIAFDELEPETSDITIGNLDGLSELERAQEQQIAVEEEDPFLETIREAQQKKTESLHPFLVQHEESLPVPKEPLPTLDLLEPACNTATRASDEELQRLAKLIETRLAEYKIKATVMGIYPGPVITRFELDLAPGVKVSRIVGLAKDIARSLATVAVRVVDTIPGKPYIGLELPNESRETVFMSEVVASERFQSAKSPISVVLGKDIAGEAIVTDLGKAPHMLVAGTTGSGKSVGVNVMIVSMLYKASPEDVRFIMIDPKMLELSVYEGIPHLLTEVVTDMKDAGNALRWCVAEMERRYKLLSKLGVRNIAGFNDKIKAANDANHPIPDPLWKEGDTMDASAPMLEKLPYIVVIVDEFADLMMVVGKKVEELIARLAQKARAAGIHLVLATQRPSVDVITGLIKANIPTRMAFTVSTKTDSRTILDQGGAESLLGMGDMLFKPNGSNHPVRIHGAFVSDDEVHRVVNNWKARGKPNYITEITHGDQGADGLLPGESQMGESGDELDALFDQVVEFVTESRRASISGVQRRFKVGYNRAARIIDQLEAQGIISAAGHNSNREVLAPPPPSRD